MRPLPVELTSLPFVDVVNKTFEGGTPTLEANAWAAWSAGLALPSIRTYLAGDRSKFGHHTVVKEPRRDFVQSFGTEAIVGSKPWSPLAPGFIPAQLADITKLSLDVDFDWDASANANAALDMWIVTDPAKVCADGDNSNIVAEVMVWFDKRGTIQPAGRYVEGGASYDLWIRAFEGDWLILTFVLKEARYAGNFDLAAVLNKLVYRGELAGNLWLRSVSMGSEIIDGEEWMLFRKFDVKVG